MIILKHLNRGGLKGAFRWGLRALWSMDLGCLVLAPHPLWAASFSLVLVLPGLGCWGFSSIRALAVGTLLS